MDWSNRLSKRIKLRDLHILRFLPPPGGFLTRIVQAAFEEQGLEVPRAAVTTPDTYALSVLIANGPFLGMHPGTMLTTPRDHPRLTAVDVRLRKTRGPIGLIRLKSRSLSPVAKLFLQAAGNILKAVRPAQSRAAAVRAAAPLKGLR